MGKLFSVIVFMGTFWIFEVIPIPVTSLFPIVLFPVFEILDQNTVVKRLVNFNFQNPKIQPKIHQNYQNYQNIILNINEI